MSKTIGNMTLKAAPVGTDAVAIADSEDLDRTKKVLLSALGGGASTIHYLDNTVTYNKPNYSATGSGITQYEDGHFYVLRLPNISSVANDVYFKYLNINNLGNKFLWYDYQNNTWPTSPTNILPYTPSISIFMYNATSDRFEFIDSSSTKFAYSLYAQEINVGRFIYFKGIPIVQNVISTTSTTPSINVGNGANRHCRYTFTQPLTSLTITNAILSDDPKNVWEIEFQFTTDSTFTFTAADLANKWLGVSAPTFDPNTSYVIAIKNGYATYSKVGA
jgi:hypothetical protein